MTNLHNQLLINNNRNSFSKKKSIQRCFFIVTLKPSNLCSWSISLFILCWYPEHNGRSGCIINMCICKLPSSYYTWCLKTTINPHKYKLTWIILYLCCADCQVGWVFQNISRWWSGRFPGKMNTLNILWNSDRRRSSGKTGNTSFKFTDFAERAYSTAIDSSNPESVSCAWNKILFLK